MILKSISHVYETEDITHVDDRMLQMFPGFDYHRPSAQFLTRRKYSHPNNSVGMQQRCFNYFWAFNTVWGTGELGVEVGSHGVRTPFCLSTDVEHFEGVDLVMDATDITLSDESILLLLANHVIEHLGMEIGELLAHWHTKLKPSGIVAAIMPDAKFNDVKLLDDGHVHATHSDHFRDEYLSNQDLFEVLEYNTLNNVFSFDIVLQKR